MAGETEIVGTDNRLCDAARLLGFLSSRPEKALPLPSGPTTGWSFGRNPIAPGIDWTRPLRHLNDPKHHCILASEAVRDYLAERFHLSAPDRTTAKFISGLQKNGALRPEQKNVIALRSRTGALNTYHRSAMSLPRMAQVEVPQG